MTCGCWSARSIYCAKQRLSVLPGRNRNSLIILRFTSSRSNPLFSRVRASQAGLLEQWIETTFHGRLNPYWLGALLFRTSKNLDLETSLQQLSAIVKELRIEKKGQA